MEEKVIVQKDLLMSIVDKCDVERVIHIPELNKLFGIPEDECYMRIRGASLEDHLRALEIQKTPYRALREVMLKAKRNAVMSEVLSLGDSFLNPELSERTAFELCIFERCVIEPKLTYSEILKLSTVAPEIVNKVALAAIEITSAEKKDGN